MDTINRDFEQYYINYKNDIYRVALWLLKDHNTAEDIVEDVFVKLYIHMLNAKNIANVRPWLILVVKRDALNYIKSADNNNLSLDSDIHAARQEINFNRLFVNDMLENLYRHNPRWYQVTEMHYFLGMSVGEIARELKCSEYSIKNSLHRARKYLQREYVEISTIIILILLFYRRLFY